MHSFRLAVVARPSGRLFSGPLPARLGLLKSIYLRNASAATAQRPSRSSQFRENGASAPMTTGSGISQRHHDTDGPPVAQEVEKDDGHQSAASFKALKHALNPDTYKAITESPFKHTEMTPVQEAVLSLLPDLANPYQPSSKTKPARDLLVRARTGTGKTLAFLVPAIEARLRKIDEYAKQAVADAGLNSDKALETRAARSFAQNHVGALIISPTRELATQIANEALKLTHHHRGFEVRLLVGGASRGAQLRDWMRGRLDIVVATPGRLRDLMQSEQGVAQAIAKTPVLILDEADTLLDMGFRDDIEDIIRHLPPVPERQTLMFSATIKREIRDIARTTLDANYQYINCVDENESPVHAHIPQYHTVLSGANKQFQHIVRLVALDQLRNPGASKIIIFLPTTKMTELVSDIFRQVSRQALPAAGNTRIYEIHSKRSQQQRTAASDTFRQDKNGASILITSDVSARGVDYPGVTNVIQMGIPGSPDQYVHRVGRTGRAGTGGRCDLVLLPWESGFLRWQLANVPIKPVTEAEITTQLQTLAEQYDQDPSKFESQVPKTRTGRGLFQGPMVTRTINDTETVLESSIPNIDHSQASEAFTSLLGYYMGKSAELRAERAAIVEGVRNWAIGAMMMEKPPYVSEQFLQRLGFSERGSGHWNRSGGARSVSDRSAPWLGRGRQSTRSEPFGRSRGESDSAEYPGSRYGRASQSLSLSGRDSQRSNDFGGGFTPSSRQERYPTRTSGSYARRTGDDEHPSRFEGLYSRRGDNRSSEGRRLTPKTWDD